MCLAQGPQRSDASEARARGPSVSSQALYHWATAPPPLFFWVSSYKCIYPVSFLRTIAAWNRLYTEATNTASSQKPLSQFSSYSKQVFLGVWVHKYNKLIMFNHQYDHTTHNLFRSSKIIAWTFRPGMFIARSIKESSDLYEKII